MTEQAGHAEDSGRPRAGQWRFRVGAMLLAGVLLAGGTCLFVWAWSGGSLERRIAAVNAAHALPPEENAATIYDQLIGDRGRTGPPRGPRAPADSTAIKVLIEASKREACWFPLSPGEQCYRDHYRRQMAMDPWATVLDSAARQDLAEGRIADAAEKLRCIARIGQHLQQQALMNDFKKGCDLEIRAWRCLAEAVMAVEATEEILAVAEAMPAELADDWSQTSRLVLEAQPLISRSVIAQWPLRRRLGRWWLELRESDGYEIMRESYLHLLSLRRGVRVLLKLRRYYEANDAWPDRLDEVRTLVPGQALIDPFANQPFVYTKAAEDEFYLYARGLNRIDENGAGDDRRVWPPAVTTSRP